MSDATLARGRAPAVPTPYGLTAWLTATDHKKIGVLYIVTSLVFFFVAVGFAMLMRTQLIRPGMTLLRPETYNQVFSMHGTTMVFLFAMPMLIGLANYMVPLMIGARDMAFPRLNALSYWVFLSAGILLYSSFLFGGALDTGWFSYAPLTEKAYSPHDGVTFWTVAIVLLGIASLLGAVNFIVTMLKLRAPGMTFWRMPLFALATFLNSFLIIFAIPSLTAAVGMLYLDRRYGTMFFDATRGGDPLIWQHLFWFFGHPEVYILIVPAFGIMSEVVPVFSRKPLFGRSTMIVMLGAIGALGFGVWAHHMFAVGLPTYFNTIMAGTSMLIAIPTGVKIFNWLATMWGGALRLTTSLLFACGMIALFTVGGITGVTVAVVPFDWQVTDTYYIVGHLHNVLIAGTVFSVFAGFYYWFPKVTGRYMDERLGKVQFWFTMVGFTLTFMPMYALGLMGMPRRVYTYAGDLGWNGLNTTASIGGYILATAFVLFAVNVVRSALVGERASGNAWGGWTLEWATSSPPPVYNFDRLPPVASDRPLWDLEHPRAEAGRAAAGWWEAPPGEAAAAPRLAVTAPQQTALPVLTALALAAVGAGLLGAWYAAPVAGVLVLAAMGVWVWQRWPEAEETAVAAGRFSTAGAGMLVFLSSEVVLFGALIFTYLHLRMRSMVWPPAGLPSLDIAFPAFNTDVLIASGVLAHFALTSYRAGRVVRFRLLFGLTIALGAAFLAGQGWEYLHVGFGLTSGAMGATFFSMTGLHAMHVTAGLLLLAYILARSVRDEELGLGEPRSTRGLVEAGTYYWHFVDVVWVVIFVLVYLL